VPPGSLWSSIVVAAVVVVALVSAAHGSQGVVKDVLRDVTALLAPEDVRRSEVDSLEDADLDDVIGQVGEARVGPSRRNGLGLLLFRSNVKSFV